MNKIEAGDTFTIAGVNRVVPSGRRWWQFWRPKWVVTNEAQVFVVADAGEVSHIPARFLRGIANDA